MYTSFIVPIAGLTHFTESTLSRFDGNSTESLRMRLGTKGERFTCALSIYASDHGIIWDANVWLRT
jgi:hypothetical protein